MHYKSGETIPCLFLRSFETSEAERMRRTQSAGRKPKWSTYSAMIDTYAS